MGSGPDRLSTDRCLYARASADGLDQLPHAAMLISFASYHLWLHWRQPACIWRGCSRTMSPASITHKFKCMAQQASLHCGFILPSSRCSTRTGAVHPSVGARTDECPGWLYRRTASYAGTGQQQSGCIIDRDYPAPIVDHLSAYRAAQKECKRRISRQRPAAEQPRIPAHGSRRNQS